MEKQAVYVVFGEYAPEPHIYGVYSTMQKADDALLEIDEKDRDRYVIVRHNVY